MEAAGAAPAWLAISSREPRIVATRDPAGKATDHVLVGEAFFLRLDVWPAILAFTWKVQ